MKLKAFDSNHFRIKSYFEDNGTQIYLVFQKVYISKRIANTDKVTVCKSEGLYDESIKPPPTSDNSLYLRINYKKYMP